MVEIDLQDLQEQLESVSSSKIHFHYNDDEITTFYFESEIFELSFQIEDDVFTIGNIEIFEQGEGLGTRIVNQIIEFCSEYNFTCIKANKIKRNKFRFWEQQDFNCDEQDCYYDLQLF